MFVIIDLMDYCPGVIVNDLYFPFRWMAERYREKYMEENSRECDWLLEIKELNNGGLCVDNFEKITD